MFWFVLFANADVCKSGQYNDCVKVLENEYSQNNPVQFRKKFKEICQFTKGLKCRTITVRGDLDAEVLEQTRLNPNAKLFKVQTEDDDLILLIEADTKKSEKSNESK